MSLFDDFEFQRRRKRLIDAGWIDASTFSGRYWRRPDRVIVTEEEAFVQLAAVEKEEGKE